MSDTLPMTTISLAAAQRVLDAAMAHARWMGRTFCICIADPAGGPVLSARMDGAPRLSAAIGVSGGSADEDAEVARAGAAALS